MGQDRLESPAPFISAAINGLVMVIHIPGVLYANLKYLPKSARPGYLRIFFVGCGGLLYTSFSIYLVWDKVIQLGG